MYITLVMYDAMHRRVFCPSTVAVWSSQAAGQVSNIWPLVQWVGKSCLNDFYARKNEIKFELIPKTYC